MHFSSFEQGGNGRPAESRPTFEFINLWWTRKRRPLFFVLCIYVCGELEEAAKANCEAVIHNELVVRKCGETRNVLRFSLFLFFPPSLTPSVGVGFSSPCWEWGRKKEDALGWVGGERRRRRRRSYHLFPSGGIPQVNKLSFFNVQSSLYGKWLFYPLVCSKLANCSPPDISRPFLPLLKRGAVSDRRRRRRKGEV